MELLSLKDVGVVAVWRLKEEEYASAWKARERELAIAREAGKPVPASAQAEIKLCATPIWQRVSGLGTATEWRLKPVERRGALMRLARTVERMIRVEWKRALGPQDAVSDRFADDERERDYSPCRYATRTALWDPVSEICHYLEIAQSKLSDLLRQATGLRVREMSDCVRAEEIRAHLKEKIRKAARGWMANYTSGAVNKEMAQLSPDEGAAVVLGEYRSGPDFLDRDGLVKKFGLGTRARLYRAVRVCENLELAELERAVALEVFLELMPELWAKCELDAEDVKELAKEVALVKARLMGVVRTG